MNEIFWEGFRKEASNVEKAIKFVGSNTAKALSAIKGEAMKTPTSALVSGTALGAGAMHVYQESKAPGQQGYYV